MRTFVTNGKNLRALRELRGFYLRDVARGANVSPSHLSRAERGERDLGLPAARRVAHFLGIPIEAILMVREEPRRLKVQEIEESAVAW